MKPSLRQLIAPFAILAVCLFADVIAISDSNAAEKVRPAYTAPQEQASALAVPSPSAPAPASIVVVTVCNQIVGMVVADVEGTLHPLNIEGLGRSQLQSVIDRVPVRLVIDAGCVAEPNKQPIF